MSNKPINDTPKCDVPGCSHEAALSTDGTEKDSQGLNRPAVKNVNVCEPHLNWPHSEDAKAFTLTDAYKKRSK